MWVNMHMSESYLDENYADQKNGGWKCMWFKALWLNIQVGECTWYVLNEGGPGGNYIPIQVTTSYLTQFVVLKGGTVQIFYESTSIIE